jgi:RNA polymerase sigma factor (sigma-70 family)
VQAAYHALLVRSQLPDTALLPWLMTTVIRIAYRRKAMARRDSRVAEQLARPRPEGTPVERVARAEEEALLRREICRLPARYRNPLVLYHLEGLSSAETARLLEIPQSTVTTRLQRGRRLLRSWLGPALAGGVLFVPWLLLDGSRMLGGSVAAPIGGVMQAKTGLLIVGVGVVAGSVGLLIGSGVLSGKDATSVRRDDGSGRHRVAEVTERLAARDAEIMELRRRLERQGAEESGPRRTPAATSAPQASDSAIRALGVDVAERSFDRVRAERAAEDLGVGRESLEIAIKAYESVRNNADPKVQGDALAALADLGETRTRAVAAMLRGVEGGGLGSRPIRVLMEAATVEGQEHLFVDLLKDDASSAWTKARVLRNLHVCDSRLVRDYLVERLGQEEDRYFSADVVMTLGRMKEARAVPLIRETLAKGGDWVPFDVYSLFALGSIGGREAEAVLLDYLRRAKLVHAEDAIAALAKIDANLARGEAQAILDRPDVSNLPGSAQEKLRQHAGRRYGE